MTRRNLLSSGTTARCPPDTRMSFLRALDNPACRALFNFSTILWVHPHEVRREADDMWESDPSDISFAIMWNNFSKSFCWIAASMIVTRQNLLIFTGATARSPPGTIMRFLRALDNPACQASFSHSIILWVHFRQIHRGADEIWESRASDHSLRGIFDSSNCRSGLMIMTRQNLLSRGTSSWRM